MNPSVTFKVLMARAGAGDDAALHQLFEEYGDAIRREIRFSLLDRRLRRVVSESDIFQSTVLRFMRVLQTGKCDFEGPRDLVNLLKCIARARVAQAARFWHAARRDIGRNVDLDSASKALPAPPVAGTSLSDADLYAMAMKCLSDQERNVFQWRAMGLSWSEIATRISAPSSDAARKQFDRMLTRVAGQLDGDIAVKNSVVAK